MPQLFSSSTKLESPIIFWFPNLNFVYYLYRSPEGLFLKGLSVLAYWKGSLPTDSSKLIFHSNQMTNLLFNTKILEAAGIQISDLCERKRKDEDFLSVRTVLILI